MRRADSMIGSILHSIDCLLTLFLTIWFFLLLTHPFLNSHPPPDSLPPFVSVPSPPASVCQTLDAVHTGLLILLAESPHRRSIIGSFPCCKVRFLMILLLSGDIHLNPGPPVQINFVI